MSNRAFGVEIECYSDSGDGEDEYDENCVNSTIDLLVAQGFQEWSYLVSHDESLYNGYGAEVKSPVLVGEDGLNEVVAVMNVLNANDYWVDASCGFHVHLNAPEFVENKKLILKAVKAWMRNQHLIKNMVQDHRWINGHCDMWSNDDLYDLQINLAESDSMYGVEGSLRGAINVSSLYYHGTIEIRQHEGTLNTEEAISWIRFCQAFVDTVTGTTIQRISDEELFLKRLKVERNASRFLSTKARIAKQRRSQRYTS